MADPFVAFPIPSEEITDLTEMTGAEIDRENDVMIIRDVSTNEDKQAKVGEAIVAIVGSASESTPGVVQLATEEETFSQSSGAKAVHPEGLSRYIRSVATIADLRNLTGLVVGQQIVVAEYISGSQVGGGEFLVSPSGGSDDGGFTIVCADGAVCRRVPKATVSTGMFGAVAGLADCGSRVRAAVSYLANNGGGKLIFDEAETSYTILTPILLPSNIEIDLNGQKLVGGGAAVGWMFETAYLSGGVVTSNLGTAPESNPVFYSKIHNGKIEQCGRVFNFYNFIFGCSLTDIGIENCQQAWKMSRCFYPRISNISARGSTIEGVPVYWFDDQTNAVLLEKVSAVAVYPFLFSSGTTAVVMDNCTAEGGTRGIKVSGECHGFTVSNCYFEAIQGTLFDLQDVIDGKFKFSGNYINYVDVVLYDGESQTAGPFLFGEWDASNFIANVGGVIEGYTYRGLMYVTAQGNRIDYKLPNNADGTVVFPANWITAGATNAEFISTAFGTGPGDYKQRAIVRGNGIIPMRRNGDTGPAINGTVAFCTLGAPALTTTIDTDIMYRPNSMFLKFVFTVQDGSGIYNVYGDVYGGNIWRGDTTGIGVDLLDFGGKVRINITLISLPYVNITGSVQICS